MSESTSDLYACTKCFTRFPFKELSRGLMMCNACRIAYPNIKCSYCRTEFQQSAKNSTNSICSKCESNVKQHGKPRNCEYCNIKAAFIGNKCQRCTHSERKYGYPITCDQCKLKCAFDRKDDDGKVDGKLLCWLCTLSYKRALAKTNRAVDKKPHIKIVTKNKERSHHHLHHKRPVRVDVTKLDYSKEDSAKHKLNSSASHSPAKIPRIHSDLMDSGSSDHIVMMSQLTEKYASLQKQLTIKENQLIEKEKYITELKAAHFTKEEEHRTLMINKKKEYDKEIESLHSKVKSMQREIASLNKKLSIKNSTNNGVSISIAATAVNSNSSNGGGSGSQDGTDGSATNSPASSS